MNFAITATDRYIGVFNAFVRAGWRPIKLFTTPLKSNLVSQRLVIDYANQHNAAIQLSRMTSDDLNDLHNQGCEALIVASYDWIICDWRPYLKYAVNFHASPLPDGRGPYPAIRAILEGWDSWAVSCHRITPEVDRGEILAHEKFPLMSDESHESLDLKTQMAAHRLAARVANQFTTLWDQALPQEAGSYWKKTTVSESVVDFHASVEMVLRHIRAFGTTGSLGKVNDTWLSIKRAAGWTESHGHVFGSVVHVFNATIVVAVKDGYVALLESDVVPPYLVTEIRARLISEQGQVQEFSHSSSP